MGPREKRLRKGRRVKLQIHQELAELEAGKINIRDVLEDPSPAMKRCQIYTVMVKTPKLGQVKVRKILTETQIWPRDRVGQLSTENREQILKRLPPRVANAYRASSSKVR
jgi:polyribonucleotide nucleotidyltransferase